MSIQGYTIGIPGAGSTNFATTPIPSMLLSRAPSGFLAGSLRSIQDQQALDSFTQSGEPVLTGAVQERYLWTLTLILTGTEWLQLASLRSWQRAQQSAHSAWVDGGRVGTEPGWKLRWIDGIEPTEPEADASRQLLVTETTAHGYEYGYPVVDALLILPPESSAWWALDRRQVQIQVVELL